MSSVYAIQHPHGFFKVGKSKSPINRYQDFRVGTPYELVLHTIMSTNGDAGELESEIHDKLSDYHWRGEWYNIPESMLIETFERFIDDPTNDAYHLQKIEYVKSSEKRRDREKSKEGGFQTAREL